MQHRLLQTAKVVSRLSEETGSMHSTSRRRAHRQYPAKERDASQVDILQQPVHHSNLQRYKLIIPRQMVMLQVLIVIRIASLPLLHGCPPPLQQQGSAVTCQVVWVSNHYCTLGDVYDAEYNKFLLQLFCYWRHTSLAYPAEAKRSSAASLSRKL